MFGLRQPSSGQKPKLPHMEAPTLVAMPTSIYAEVYLKTQVIKQTNQVCVIKPGFQSSASVERCPFRLHLKQPELVAKAAQTQTTAETSPEYAGLTAAEQKAFFPRGQTSHSRI